MLNGVAAWCHCRLIPDIVAFVVTDFYSPIAPLPVLSATHTAIVDKVLEYCPAVPVLVVPDSILWCVHVLKGTSSTVLKYLHVDLLVLMGTTHSVRVPTKRGVHHD